MSPTSSAPVISPERLATAYSYASYRQLIDEALAQGRTTGPEQSAELTDYTVLNVQRMSRLDKTVKLLPELVAAATGLRQNYIWLIITEGWCGDAAQQVPVFEALAQASAGHLRTAYLLRDDNLDLADRYHTNGSRSIPKLVVLRADTLTEVTHWGPRPAEAQALIIKLKAEGMAHDDFIRELHAWYAHDRTQATQHELLALLQQLD
ncbi:thioredoxin family protein [Hymenobacter sp. H14-R3]|uniref:thioredoxin family protein n=1 Tax=Hymenobacter sp. H14-R3 TaxID=3046308 RepID=UPI0024B8D58F|nr:thioredoxin family protein [Hymenobacter sp. H14-R3]MDJ0365576.1 thioredoxin family protein [Hymenobacter sp. H14-R3]